MVALHNNLLALDIGEVRVGVALATHGLNIARPLTTLANDTNIAENIQNLVEAHEIGTIVVGLPRGLDSQSTSQTKKAEEFSEILKSQLSVKVEMQDEALTSVRAKESLEQTGKQYTKSDIDAVAASLILSDYIEQAGTL